MKTDHYNNALTCSKSDSKVCKGREVGEETKKDPQEDKCNTGTRKISGHPWRPQGRPRGDSGVVRRILLKKLRI